MTNQSYRAIALTTILSLLTPFTIEGFSAATPSQNNHCRRRPATSTITTSRLYSDASGTSSDAVGGVGSSNVSAEAQAAAEYEYNEADFADYVSDYSDINADDDDDDADAAVDDLLNNEDMDQDILEFMISNAADLTDDTNNANKDNNDNLINGVDYGFDLSPFEAHAREVFLTYAEQVRSTIDLNSPNLSPSESYAVANNAILQKDLYSMLQTLDIDATEDESKALFKYLDENDDGSVTLDEFLPWYAQAVDTAQQSALSFQNLVKSRRTVHKFDATEVDDAVLRRALECAIAAPNRRGTEPWRFIKLGKETVGKVVKLREEMNKKEGVHAEGSFVSWTKVPHWIVVTYTKAAPNSGPDGKMQQREDFKSTCCAVQNLLLSMWSEGIGTKWTDGPIQRTDEFAEICGIDLTKEKVAGVIWYGFAKGGLNRAQAKWRRKGVEEVLDILP